MMGPWLVYAALMNKAALALFSRTASTRKFAELVENAGVTMLGLVPSLVSAWRKRAVWMGSTGRKSACSVLAANAPTRVTCSS